MVLAKYWAKEKRRNKLLNLQAVQSKTSSTAKKFCVSEIQYDIKIQQSALTYERNWVRGGRHDLSH